MPRLTTATEGTQPSRRERLIALCIFGLLALNYPLLELFNRSATWLGIPVLLLYLMLVWGGVIILTAWILESDSDHPPAAKSAQQQVEKKNWDAQAGGRAVE